jgi:hypothetical protein
MNLCCTRDRLELLLNVFKHASASEDILGIIDKGGVEAG